MAEPSVVPAVEPIRRGEGGAHTERRALTPPPDASGPAAGLCARGGAGWSGAGARLTRATRQVFRGPGDHTKAARVGTAEHVG